MKRVAPGVCVAAASALAAACAVGPDYHRPQFDTASSYKESGDWQPSEPKDTLSRGPWWKIFNDDDLDRLEAQIDISNQNVKAAEAAFEQARALVSQARAGFWPTIAATFGMQRQGQPVVTTSAGAAAGVPTGGTGTSTHTQNTYSTGVSANWDIDIFFNDPATTES